MIQGLFYRRQEVARCPLCGRRHFQPHSRNRRGLLDIRLKSCRNCSFVIQSPRLTEESLAKYYRSRRARQPDDVFERGLRRGAYIGEFLEKNGVVYKSRTIFEAGCGHGGILEYFKRSGCRVAGCDLNKVAAAYGTAKGLDIRTGSIEALRGLGFNADMIILSHVVEHLPEPAAFLRDVKGLLNGGGVLYIETPGLKGEKMNMKRFAQIGHLNYFSLDTIRLMVQTAGLEFMNGNEIIQAVFRKRDIDDKR